MATKKRDAQTRRTAALGSVRELLGELATAVERRYGAAPTPQTAESDARALVDLAAELAALLAGPGPNDGG